MTGPLSGLRVVDASQGVAGPSCALALADAGADVVKVEHGAGDMTREWSPRDHNGRSVSFDALNRSKRGLYVDLAEPGAEQVLEDLLAEADVLVLDAGEPALAGTPLDGSRVRERNPRLVTCTVSGFGRFGPWRDRPGAELPAQLFSEFTTSLGRIGEPPVRLGTDAAGMYAGVHAVQGVLAALLAREERGRGDDVQVSLFGSLIAMRSTLWVALSRPDEWGGFHLDNYVKPPFHGYRCRDGYVYIELRALPVDARDRLIADLDMEWVRSDPLADLFLTDTAGGSGWHAHVVVHLWERAFAQLPVADVVDLVERHGGSATPVNSYAAVLEDPQVRHLDAVGRMQPTDAGTRTPYVSAPWRFSDGEQAPAVTAPEFGEQLRGLAGTWTDRAAPRAVEWKSSQ